MDVNVLIDAIVRQTTVLIASLATATGGRASLRSADRSVLGCRLAVGANSPGLCTDADTTRLNGTTPAFSVGNAAFKAKRISSPPSSMVASSACDTARRVFPTEFPPTVP